MTLDQETLGRIEVFETAVMKLLQVFAGSWHRPVMSSPN
jgi:hypothetical protein